MVHCGHATLLCHNKISKHSCHSLFEQSRSLTFIDLILALATCAIHCYVDEHYCSLTALFNVKLTLPFIKVNVQAYRFWGLSQLFYCCSLYHFHWDYR